MYRVMYNSNVHYVSCRAGVYYYTRRVPIEVRQCAVGREARMKTI